MIIFCISIVACIVVCIGAYLIIKNDFWKRQDFIVNGNVDKVEGADIDINGNEHFLAVIPKEE